jgi:hypothetical protein
VKTDSMGNAGWTASQVEGYCQLQSNLQWSLGSRMVSDDVLEHLWESVRGWSKTA